MTAQTIKIKKSDIVEIISGKERGKTGKVMNVDPKHYTITVEGLNMYKKHQRPRKQGEKGEIVEVVRPVHASNVLLYCSHCKKGVRIGIVRKDGKRMRQCKKCKTNL